MKIAKEITKAFFINLGLLIGFLVAAAIGIGLIGLPVFLLIHGAIHHSVACIVASSIIIAAMIAAGMTYEEALDIYYKYKNGSLITAEEIE